MDEQQADSTAETTSGARLVYANASRNIGGPFDIRMEFGYQPGSDDTQPVVSVIMSWEHAQAFADSLGKMLAEFQQIVGPLPDVRRFGAGSGEEAE